MRYANRMKMFDFQPNWDSLNWVWRLNWKKKTSLFVYFLGASYMQEGSEMKFFAPCRRNLILFDFSGYLLLISRPTVLTSLSLGQYGKASVWDFPVTTSLSVIKRLLFAQIINVTICKDLQMKANLQFRGTIQKKTAPLLIFYFARQATVMTVIRAIDNRIIAGLLICFVFYIILR